MKWILCQGHTSMRTFRALVRFETKHEETALSRARDFMGARSAQVGSQWVLVEDRLPPRDSSPLRKHFDADLWPLRKPRSRRPRKDPI